MIEFPAAIGSAEPPGFLRGGGRATQMICGRDWTDHPLGPPETWPAELRSALSLVLNSPESMILCWGPELSYFFNDAYAPLLGPRVSWAMGARFQDVWADAWAQARPIIDAAFEGRSVRYEDLPWKLETDRGAADTWFSFSYSRVLDGEGRIAGLFILTNETTARVVSEAATREATEALRRAEAQLRRAQQAGGIGVFSTGADGILDASPEFFALYGMPCRADTPAGAFERLVVPEDAAKVSTLEGRIAGQAPLNVEYRIRRADTGALRWIARRGEIERDAEGGFLRFVGVAIDITSSMAMRHALEAEREQLAQMFEQAPTFMALLRGPEHRIERVNPGYTRLLAGRDVVGKTVAEALPDAVAQGYLALLDEVYRSGEAYAATSARYVVQTDEDGTGRERFVDFVYQPLRDAAGQVHGIFVEGVDVTERMRAGAALSASQERYSALFSAIDAGFCVIEMIFDEAGRPCDYLFLESNPAFERQTGLVGAIGRRMRELAPGHEQHWFDRYGKVAETGQAVRFEHAAATLGRHYDVHAYRVGEPAEHRVAVLFNDISERKRVEQELRRLNATLEEQVRERTADRNALWHLSRDLMLRCTVEGIVTAVNPAWTELLGWTTEELVGANLFDLIHPDDRERTLDVVPSIVAGESHLRFDNRYRTRGGDYRWISWSARPGDGMINAVGRDITGDMAQAEVLQRTEEQLRQAQKMEAVGQLTGGIAHDFNNLLTGISGSLELLTRRMAQGRFGDVERYVTAAQGAATRAAALTHRLLAFSRRQTLDPKPTDLNRLVAGMEEMIRRSVGPGIAIEVRVVEGLWTTLVDPGQLENALLNLCINARDAMPDGGRIRIETANLSLDPAAAAAHELPAGEYIQMTVHDTGSGMAPDVIARAFDPFFTTKPTGQGTGLGLSMVYGFARQSGGHVRIHSELGRGTDVWLYLPRHIGEAAVSAAAGLPGLGPRAEAGQLVLVVDDEPSVRMLVIETLEDLGYAAIEAADGPSGLKVLQSNARIDLLVTDVGLPGGMNGRQMVDAARVGRPDLKVLFITGYAETAVTGHGNQMEPGLHVITKPFAMDALAARIREIIAAR